VLTVPIASVTTRLPKPPEDKAAKVKTNATNSASLITSSASAAPATNTPSVTSTNTAKTDKKSKDAPKPIEVVFVLDGDHVKMSPVKIGVSDDSYWELTEGLKESDEVISGGYKAINRELEDGKKVRKGPPPKEDEKK